MDVIQILLYSGGFCFALCCGYFFIRPLWCALPPLASWLAKASLLSVLVTLVLGAIDETYATYKSLGHKKKELEGALRAASQRIAEVEHENKKLRVLLKTIQRLKLFLASTHQRIAEAKGENARLKQVIRRKGELEMGLDAANQRIADLEENAEREQQAHELVLNDAKERTAEIECENAELRPLVGRNEELEIALSAANQHAADLEAHHEREQEALKVSLDETTQRIAQVEHENTQLRSQVKKAEVIKTSLNAARHRIAELERNTEHAKEAHEALETSLCAANERITQVEGENARFKPLVKTNQELAASLSSANHRISVLESHNNLKGGALFAVVGQINRSTIAIEPKNEHVRTTPALEADYDASLRTANDSIAELERQNQQLRQGLDNALSLINDTFDTSSQHLDARCGEVPAGSEAQHRHHQNSSPSPTTSTATPTYDANRHSIGAEKSERGRKPERLQTNIVAATPSLAGDGVIVRDFAREKIVRASATEKTAGNIVTEQQAQESARQQMAQDFIKDELTRYAKREAKKQDRDRDHSQASSTSTTSNRFEKDLHTAGIEMIIRQRVLKKVDLAFEACRKEGKFKGEEMATTKELSTTETTVCVKKGKEKEKARFDSLTGAGEELKEACREI